ncbi:MAG: TlpA family protein disulfide reductase [Gaiellaceae bacterium]
MPARLKLAAQAVAVAGVGLLLTLLVWDLTHQTPLPKVGAAAPAFSLSQLDGRGDLTLASLRGKVVVLNFWASWCGPCKREAPALQKVWQQYRGKGVVVLGVDTGDAKGDARRFLSAHGITYPVVLDPNRTLALGSYGVPVLPTTFVLTRAGRLVGSPVIGPISDKGYSDEFHRDFEEALKS